MKKIFVIIAMLMLVLPAMYAQIDYSQKAREFLSQGDCEKAEFAYQDYKREHPNGNAEIEAAIKRCIEEDNNDATTGTLNGHEWVDLGLPSGTKWATCNVGASKLEEYGNYYAWGETSTKTTYDWSTYRYSNGSYDRLTKYCSKSYYGSNGFTDYLKILQSSDDAATANWGKGWRMPTRDEFEELTNNCTITWTTLNEVNGRLFTGPNGNYIFLPAAGYRNDSELYYAGSYGYYWSSSLNTDDTDGAWYHYFNSGCYYVDDGSRSYGYTVRAVCQSQN